eukprot:Hpha_TRINITY_DN14049_c0_g1::TRINITY_DN14049_c0_g1_i1::g.43907::m.43907
MGCCCEKSIEHHKYNVWSSPAPQSTDRPGVVVVIVNPYSGGKTGMKTFDRARVMLEEKGVTVRSYPTERCGHALELARDLNLEGVDIIATVGGDGTIHEAMNGLMKRKDGLPKGLRVGVIPAGSGNTFAYDLGFITPEESAQAMLDGCARPIDILELSQPEPDTLGMAGAAAAAGGGLKQPLLEGAGRGDKMYSLNMIGWALPAAVLRRANSLRCCGGAQYNCAAYCELIASPSYPARVHVHGVSGGASDADRLRLAGVNDYAMINIQLTVHMGEKIPLCPRAKLDDGLMDICLIKKEGRIKLANTMEAAKVGAHESRIEYVQCEAVTIDPAPERCGVDTVNVDGELAYDSPFTVRCLPRALTVCVPAHIP